MTRVLYPGSFDPMTKGHMNIVDQALGLFDEVVVAVMNNPAKKSAMFTPEERVGIIKALYQNNPRVRIVLSEGATVDVAKECVVLL